MARFLSFGSINIDYTYSLHHIVREGETLASSALTVSAGGKGANQSAALAKAGCEVYHAGRIGKDGLFILDMLEKAKKERDRHITLGMLHAESNLEFTETVTNVIQKHIQSNQIRGGKWGHD